MMSTGTLTGAKIDLTVQQVGSPVTLLRTQVTQLVLLGVQCVFISANPLRLVAQIRLRRSNVAVVVTKKKTVAFFTYLPTTIGQGEAGTFLMHPAI